MPLYEYQCMDCGEKFEARHSIYSRKSPKCPKCKSETVKRVFSVPNQSSTYDSSYKPTFHFG